MGNQQFSSIPSHQPSIASLSGIGDLLGRAWRIYKERIWVFLGIMILPTLSVFIVGSIFSLQSNQLPRYLWIWIIIIPIIALIATIIYLWSGVSLLFAVKERELRIGIKESFAKGWSKIISYFWISVLVFLITLAGFMLLIIPGIIFTIWFSLAAYVLVAEGLTGTKALSRSKRLVSGFWWKVFWRFLIVGAIAIVFSIAIDLISKTIGIPENINVGPIILPFFFSPFAAVYAFLIYEELKKIKEGASV